MCEIGMCMKQIVYLRRMHAIFIISMLLLICIRFYLYTIVLFLSEIILFTHNIS